MRQRFLQCVIAAKCRYVIRSSFIYVTGSAAAIARCVWFCDCASIAIIAYKLVPTKQKNYYRLEVFV